MPPLNGKTILVVDDEADVRELLVSELTRYNCRILEAESGAEAFSLVKKKAPDLVIADIKMPNGDGVQLLEKIKKLYPQAPRVVIMTAGSLPIPVEELKKKGAALILKKPFNLARLVEELSELVDTPPLGGG